MSHYGDPSIVRRYAGLPKEKVTDEDLGFFIEQADTIVFEDVAIQELNEQMCGKLDGINSTFTTYHKFIADTDYDSQIDANEVTVYGWGKCGTLRTRDTLTVSSINPLEGKIYLTSAPSSTYDCITIDYYYYRDKPVFHLLRKAANLWAAYEYIFSEYLLIPTSMRRGALSYKHTKPYLDLRARYYEVISMFNKKPFVKKKHPDITMGEKYLNEY